MSDPRSRYKDDNITVSEISLEYLHIARGMQLARVPNLRCEWLNSERTERREPTVVQIGGRGVWSGRSQATKMGRGGFRNENQGAVDRSGSLLAPCVHPSLLGNFIQGEIYGKELPKSKRKIVRAAEMISCWRHLCRTHS